MGSSKKTPKQRTKKKQSSKSVHKKTKIFLWFSFLSTTILALFIVLQLPPPDARQTAESKQPKLSEPEPAIQQKQFKKNKADKEQKARHKMRTKVSAAPDGKYSYEEKLGTNLERKIREIDLALLQAMITSGLGPSRLKHQDVEKRQAQGQSYHYQTIDLSIAGEFDTFMQHLQNELANLVKNASLKQFYTEAPIWEISILGHPTHLLLLNSDPNPPYVEANQNRDKQAFLAIIIDDIGENLHQASALINKLDLPITLSILPFATYSDKISRMAMETGQETLLHLPLEPKGFPDIDPGPGALFVNMDEQELTMKLRQNLNQVPAAIGVNNHMGSRFTEYTRGMKTVFQELKKRKLFFLDSLTTPKSQVRKVASELGLNYLNRQIFLDNKQNEQAIIYQLQKAERIALSRGKCIAIGHPYPETLTALAKWAKTRSAQVQVCKLSTLL